jgi:hypothetical protein
LVILIGVPSCAAALTPKRIYGIALFTIAARIARLERWQVLQAKIRTLYSLAPYCGRGRSMCKAARVRGRHCGYRKRPCGRAEFSGTANLRFRVELSGPEKPAAKRAAVLQIQAIPTTNSVQEAIQMPVWKETLRQQCNLL